jgi:hypothetical protein
MEFEGEVAGHLSHPPTVGVRRDLEQVYHPGPDFDHEESVEALAETGPTRKKPLASMLLACARRNSVHETTTASFFISPTIRR